MRLKFCPPILAFRLSIFFLFFHSFFFIFNPSTYAAGSYIQLNEFTCNGRNTWVDMDLSGVVPTNAVLEIAIGNLHPGAAQFGGVRANGSSLDRNMDIREAETSGIQGYEWITMHVQADSNAVIECFSEIPETITIRILGYWDCPGGGCYTERFDILNAAVAGVWEDENLSGFGVSDGDVVEVLAENSTAALSAYLGVRTDGSSLDRRIDLNECEVCGDSLLTLNAVAIGGSATIEIYEEILSTNSFRLMGYWANPPGTYQETFDTITAPTTDNSWQDRDLTALGVPDNAVVELVLANGNNGTSNMFGARANNSALHRTTALMEAEDPNLSSTDTNRQTSRMHVQTDAGAVIEIFHEDVSDTAYEFQLVGYWSTGTYNELNILQCDGRNAWADMDISGFVPDHAVVEIAIGNTRASAAQISGVRANGSSLVRNLDIAEAETAGVKGHAHVTMTVQADANGVIECFAEIPEVINFSIIGYWDCPGGGCYTERMDTLNASTDAVWEDVNLSSYGVSGGDVVEVLGENSLTSAAREVGIRTDGSTLERRFDLTEAENGGDMTVTMNAVAVGGSATIEIYQELVVNTSFRLLGYWSNPPPGEYVEAFSTITAPTADNSWQDRDLTGVVPADATAEIILANGAIGTANVFGVRANDTPDHRALPLMESEIGGRNTVRMHVLTDASAIIEIFHEDASDTPYEFQVVGYWWIPPSYIFSISITANGNIAYGYISPGGSRSTHSSDMNTSISVLNDGNTTATLNIRGQNAACPWTLASSSATDQYAHQFCRTTDVSCTGPPTNYTALTTSYQALYTSVPQDESRIFDLRIIAPDPSTCTNQQSVDVTIQAVAP